jgi:uncharacterized repeat protein (TIGR01451 family)
MNDMKPTHIIALVMVCISLLICAASADIISVGNGQVSTIGDSTSVNLVYDSAPAGLSGYSINVNVSDPTVAIISGVSFPGWATIKDNTTLPSSSCNLKASDLNEQVQAGATSIPLANLTIKGLKAGSTTIAATVVRMNDDNDARLTPTVQPGTFTVHVPPVQTWTVIADHTNATLQRLAFVPESAIVQAKSTLHIAYGHTSHGSQITDGMTGLTAFAGAPNGGSSYQWNNGGSGGALDLRDTPFTGADDLGNPDYTAWATATRNYLNSHPDINVVMWSWCGQADTTADNINTYLSLMSQLEQDYPGVKFVYMTGHLVGTGVNGNLNQRNEQIRTYCREHNKILFDFADIESYDPDGLVNYMALNADDACNYNGGNWATAWQNNHTQGVDWYQCSAAHTQPLNGNMKAYAAWWMWARLGGWDGSTTVPDNPMPSLSSISPNNATAGGAAFTLTVDGSNFVRGSIVRWAGAGRTTVYQSPTRLTASIPASDIASQGTAQVAVFNPTPGGGLSSGAPFTISGTTQQKGNISVTSTPGGATISLDGAGTGNSTPSLLTGINPGSHTVSVSLAGYVSQNATVNVVAGSTVNSDFQLVPVTGHTVPVMTGQVEGSVIALQWDVINDADLSGYKVVISKNNSHPKYPEDGYMYWITDRNQNHANVDNVTRYNGGDFGGYLSPGQKYYFSITALYNDNAKIPGNVIELVFPSGSTGQYGSLGVTSNPSNATVSIDGNDTGQSTPVTFTNVPAGNHSVSVSLSGYVPASKTVMIIAGATSHADFSLTAATMQAGLAIHKTVSDSAITVGENVTWTVSVVNTGPDPATDVVIDDRYSDIPGIVINAVNPPTTGILSGDEWQIPRLEKDQGAEFSVTTSFMTAGNKINSASITGSSTSDPDLSDNNASASVTVEDHQILPPVAGFDAAPTAGNAPLTVRFNDTSTGDGINSWAWDFNNDGVIDSTARNPDFTYVTTGNYSVSLTVANAGGNNTRLMGNLISVTGVQPGSVVARITPASSVILPGNSQQFQILLNSVPTGLSGGKLSVTLTNPAAGTITNVTPPTWAPLNATSAIPASSAWIEFVDIGQNVQPGATDVPVGTFTIQGINPGESGISITVLALDSDSGDALASDVIDGTFTVPSAVHADFTGAPTAGNAPLTVQFNDTSTGDGINQWAWDFNNDGVVDSLTRDPVFTYASAGTYSVNLTVSNADSSDSNLKTGYIVVSEEVPAANFTASPESGTAPLLVQFNDTSTGTGITSWAWDFNNDGVVDSSTKDPVFTYASAGTYSVSLTVANGAGNNTELKTNYITVSEPASAPVANFTANITKGIIPFTVQFNDASTGTSLTSWAWDLNGDGLIDSNAKDPAYTYDKPGRFTVNLTVTNAVGSDTITKTNCIVGDRYVEAFPGYSVAPTDPDFDGLYEDINGNGRLDFDDVVAFYLNMQWVRDNSSVGILPFDFNHNGRIDYDDVVQLYLEVLHS